MTSAMLTFGDIFFYSNEEYVYLAMSGQGVIYAARILSNKDSEMFVQFRDGAIKKDGEQRTSEKIVFCFIQLKTEGYSKRVAHLNQSDSQKNPNAILVGRPQEVLCEEDMLALRDEIINGPVPLDLKQQVESLDFASLSKSE